MRYFEDIETGKPCQSGPYRVLEQEIREFATRWDPRPYHIDSEAALRTPFNGLVASGAHTICIYYRLLYNLNQLEQEPMAAIAAFGFEVKLPHPVRPGDSLLLHWQALDKRESSSNPRAGIVRTQSILKNQSGETVLEAVATGLFAKRVK